MKSKTSRPVPDLFCWTRFGGEAGEPVEQILVRKEAERASNGGTFLWGIGNALGPSIFELIRRTNNPQVIFSPIKGSPRPRDISPPAVVRWTEAKSLDGSHFLIPSNSRVTSRYDPAAPKQCHFALVCHSAKSLLPLQRDRKIGFRQLRNLRTGRPVGASQVSAVVELTSDAVDDHTLIYEVAILATLAYPYFLRLTRAEDR
jgi:hypothetical protein